MPARCLGVGALVGILFPPSIIAGTVVGGTAAGLIGHLGNGISRGELKDFGESLQDGQAAIVAIGESKIEERLQKAATRANKIIEEQLDADADELKKDLDEAAKQGEAT